MKGRIFLKKKMRGCGGGNNVGEHGRVSYVVKGQGHGDLRGRYVWRDRGNHRWYRSVS